MPLAFGVCAVWGLKARKDVKKRLALLVGEDGPHFASLTMHLRLPDTLSCHILSLVFPHDLCANDSLNQLITAIFKPKRILQPFIVKELVFIEFKSNGDYARLDELLLDKHRLQVLDNCPVLVSDELLKVRMRQHDVFPEV